MRQFSWLLLLSLAVICRYAAGGEGIAVAAAADPLAALWRILLESGPLGVFITYLIWRSRHDDTRRKEDIDRIEKITDKVITVTEKYSTVITGVNSCMDEMRGTIQENTIEMRRVDTTIDRLAYIIDKDHIKGPTRIIKKSD